MKAELFEATQGKASRLGKTSAKRAADTMMEMFEYPEHFCAICHKRKGVCKHKTGGR